MRPSIITDVSTTFGLALLLLRGLEKSLAFGIENQIFEYPDYSQEEKDRVKNNFLNTINKYINYPAFAGIKFSDEHGVKEFPALKAATEIFKENYRDKIY